VSIAVSEEHRELLKTIDADTRDRFLYDMRLRFLNMPVGYRIEFPDDEPEAPTRLTFVYNILDEEPQKSGFFRRSHRLQSAALLGTTMLQKLARFGEWD
jgi:hypothetical protein